MSTASSRTELFESAPVHKAFFALALPSVFGKIIMLLYNLADTWFIASTNNADIVAGVALIAPVFTVMIALGDIFGVGGSSLISRLMGQKDSSASRRTSGQCFYGALTLGAVMTVLLLVIRDPLLMLLGADSSTYPHARDYYTYIALGAPFIIANVTPMNLLRAEGMAKASMLGSISGSVTNILLDPLFIFTFRLGAAGAAIATVIANMVSLAVYAGFYRKAEWISIAPKFLRFHWADLKNIGVIGIPAALNNLMNSFASALTNRVLVPYGSEAVAAWSIAGRCTMIVTMLLVSFSFSSLPLVGYNYGRRNSGRLKQILKFLYTFEVLLALSCSAVMALFAPHLVRAFMEDPVIVSLGSRILRFHLISTCFTAVILISTCTFQATGNAKATMAATLGRQGLLFIPILLTASSLFGFTGILFAQPAADLLTVVLVCFLMKRSRLMG